MTRENIISETRILNATPLTAGHSASPRFTNLLTKGDGQRRLLLNLKACLFLKVKIKIFSLGVVPQHVFFFSD